MCNIEAVHRPRSGDPPEDRGDLGCPSEWREAIRFWLRFPRTWAEFRPVPAKPPPLDHLIAGLDAVPSTSMAVKRPPDRYARRRGAGQM